MSDIETLCRRIDEHLSDIGSGWMADDEMEEIRDALRDMETENISLRLELAGAIELGKKGQARIAELEKVMQTASDALAGSSVAVAQFVLREVLNDE